MTGSRASDRRSLLQKFLFINVFSLSLSLRANFHGRSDARRVRRSNKNITPFLLALSLSDCCHCDVSQQNYSNTGPDSMETHEPVSHVSNKWNIDTNREVRFRLKYCSLTSLVCKRCRVRNFVADHWHRQILLKETATELLLFSSPLTAYFLNVYVCVTKREISISI